MPIPDDLFGRTLAAAYDLHRHPEAAGFDARLARVLAQAIACDSALVVTVDPGSADYRLESWPAGRFGGVDRAAAARLHQAHHPFVAHCRRSRSAGAFRLTDLAPRGTLAGTGLADLYRSLGIGHQLLMLAASPDANWRAIALNRSTPAFSDEERLALEALWPHITLAQRKLRREARSRTPSLEATRLDEGAGVIIITSEGSVTLCSERARVWLNDYFGTVSIRRGVVLPAGILEWARKRLAGEAKGKSLRAVRRDPFIVARGERSLVADLIVDHGKDLHLLRLEEVLLNAPAATLESLGLTPREAEVLSWVAQGKTNREVGMILGSSDRTVQKHLEHIFQKIGVESRTAAILKAWATRPSSRG